METHNVNNLFLVTRMCSYRTYEEWKQVTVKVNGKEKKGSSYRTYEEWKHELSKLEFEVVAIVLTVPMRNGNSIPRFEFKR